MGELELMMMTMMLIVMVIVAVMLSPSMAWDGSLPDRYLTEITRLWESWS